MRYDGPYMPTMDWQQDKHSHHIYNAKVDGKYACRINRDYLSGMRKIWRWSVNTESFRRSMPKDEREGYELTARLAVKRAEEAFDRMMQQPERQSNPVINIQDQPISHHKRRR